MGDAIVDDASSRRTRGTPVSQIRSSQPEPDVAAVASTATQVLRTYHFHRHRNGGGSPSPDAPGDGAGTGAGANAGAQESDAGTDNDASEWNITALAWCKPPSAKLGSHPLDPDASYCAAFAVGSFGRVSIFNPTERNVLEWELISVLEPAGAVQCLTWASEGRHLVSGGTQLVLWSPEANAIGPSGASSIAGSVHSGGSAAFTSANTDRNHARLLASRSPAATNGTLSPSGATLGEDDVRSEPFTRRRNHVTSESELRAASEHGGDFSPRDADDLPGYEFPRQSMDGANSLDSEDERIAAFDASWVLEEADGQITLVDFSADSRMFASVSEHSLEVRVWFEGDSLFGNMDYLSLFHPREILALQWRARSDGHSYHVKAQHSHTPQSLVTLCADHIVRIWQESDPQTEELAMFVAIHIDTRHRPLRSIGWLKFINYFEGLRSPFPEHNMYAQVREDFVVGFSSASPFFQSHAHQTTVWGDHQKQSVELRTGPIAQESQSSLDWLVAVDQAGQVCMWSLEGLSDSPRRDIHISPWNKSCSKIFSHVELGSNSNPLVLRRPDDVYLTRHVCGQSDEELLHYESREDFFDEAATRRSAPTNWAAHVYNSFVATCRVTQEFDPHTERDPWPSTCVFDINPRNIETLSFGESGLVYSFAENDTMKMNSAYGTVTHMTLCLARGHTTEITEIVYERVIDLASNYSSLEEAYWVTTIDRSGFAVAWPVRSGSREEDVDADAIVRSGAVPLPMEGNISRAIVSEIAEHHMICLIIDHKGRAHLWLRLGIAAYSWSEAAVPDALQTAIGAFSGEPARYVFAVRDGRYKVHFGIHTASNDLVIVPVTEIMRAVPDIEVGETRVRQFSSGASPLCVAPVSDKQLFGHGALALVALENGKCELQGFAEEGPIETFVLIPDDPATSIANASSGGIVTVHESGLVRVWAPGLCHLSHGLQSTICVQDDVAGRCTVETASALYLGAGVSVLGIGIHEAAENGQSAAAKVLLYSRARSGFSLVARDQAVEFKLLGSTRAALRRAKLVGIAWSGRDFGLIAATSNQLHLFQGWVRHPPVGDMAKELNMLRRRMQLEGKGVSSSRTEQLEALNGLGDAAVALQLPMALHRPRPILELLRAGCVSPVRAILKTILAALEEKKQENEDAYGQDEAPPRSAMFVSAPDIELHEIVREIWNDAENEMAPSTTDHEDAASQDAAQSQDDTSGGKDTAAALFADDDWSMGGPSTQRTTGGAAAALFDEDPWDSMLTSSAAQTTLSDPTQDVERSRSELAELLVSYTIKDMPPLEQLQLTALAGVFDDVYGMNDADKGGFGDSVDKCGAKFMLAYQLFRVSKRVLPLSERPRAMPTADLLWALDSDSQDALLAKCLPPGESTWDDAKEIGVGLWLRSTHAVRVLAEDLAKVQFKESKTKDPFSCALFYFALNKASVVSGLFKLAKNTKAAELLANDFSDEHWQTVAVKNAYSLLRKKRYLEAASFFVLGKRLAEAVNVCIKNLGDFQLAVFVCKLVEGADGEVQRTVWEYTIKPLALYTMDHWLASMCHTVAGDPVGALLAFVEDREAFLAEQQQHGETKVGGAVPGDASESAILGTTSADEEGFRVFDDLPTLLRKGLVNKELLEKLRSGGAGTKGDDARESSTLRMVPLPDRVSKLRQDLHAVNEQLARCPPQDILESLWRISRASNHLAVEFTVIRMLSDVNQPAFLIRLQQLLHSVMDSFVALGHGNATLGVAAERTLLPGRRLAAYAVLLVDLAAAAHEIFHAAPVIPGLDKLHLPPALTARKPRDDNADDSNGNNGVNNGSGDAGNGAGQEPESADEEISEIAQQYREMLDAYARVALFAAAYSMGQHGLVQALLDESFAPSAIRQTGLELANTWFDYEELLMFAASAHHRQGKNFRDDLTALSGTVGEDEVESEEEDMVAWGLTYAERLMNVAVMRSVLTLVTRVRDKLYLMQGQPPQLVHSPKSGSTPGSPTSPAEKALHPEVYCLELMEELVQSCWPVNWAMLANLYMSSIPVGLSSAARSRLEQMKVQAFADEDKSKLWNAIKGKEQLRIVDATARWTGRSIDQEQARSGIIPDSTIFCTDNAKVVHSASGTLFLSVDPVHALDGTLVVASEKGCEDAGQIWFNDSLRIPLNNNLYCDSFLHRVSSHSRVEALLQSSRSLSSNGSSASDGGHGGSRTRLLPHVSSHHKKNEETVRTVMHVSSHPFLPLYVTAQYDGSAMIWDAARDPEEPVVRLRKPSDDARKWKHGHTTRVRISEDGMRFAACDSAGHVLLWNLADCRDSENEPFGQFACHTKRTLDCAFLNYNGNIFASAGQSQHSENLCLWDLSMPPRSCRVASVHCCAHSVAYSLAYLQDQQVVIVGGGNGQIGVFDLRQRMLILEEDHVHSKAIRSLAVHPTGGRYFASGSTDGSVKLWSYRSGRLASHAHLTNMHPTHMFVNELTSDSILSQRGTTDVTFSRDFLYSCGADGTVKMTPLSSLAL
ncbi:DmX-like protein 1 [Hondaea fermentalgiana]|uniref:DmX-like protein 1 n=1 Tax=Hondaea fermentalgiana TaxID=2315210 RepID=A0A2R5GLE9_9STRA|nr:DmX-like protein 1 [Hondaea fermentalgiana]|eukprot:GBG31732.1 DmX-like protein 1 [Hondaea fermentalgiana]